MSPDGSVFYFAYGSNTDPARFESRVGPWRSCRRATLPGYRLRFARMVQSEGGGGAFVDRSHDPDAQVQGVLFEITPAQLEAMDKEEFDPTRDVATVGKRIQVTVQTADGPVPAELYTVDDDGAFCAPSETYLAHILRGLEAAGYSEDALAAVRTASGFPTRSGSPEIDKSTSTSEPNRRRMR